MRKPYGEYTLRTAVGITGIIILVLLLAGSAQAATLTVCESRCMYSSIQNAIDNSISGDTIVVQNGTYYENVNVTKQLTLRGIGMPVVDARGSSIGIPVVGIRESRTAIVLSADGVTLEGFTATGADQYNIVKGLAIYSNNNTLIGNNVSNNTDGITLWYSSNNMLNSNNVSNNGRGIYLFGSNNTLVNNIMTENKDNFEVVGGNQSNYNNDIDTSNLINDKPIYYIKYAMNTVYDSSIDAGTFYCINCVNVTIKDLSFSENNYGISFWNTTNSRIQNVNISNNYWGISLAGSSNNTLIGNNVSNNSFGIYLSSSSNNTLIGNNVSNNRDGITLWSSSNNMLNGNNASNNYDEGIFLQYSGSNTFVNNIMTKNNQNFRVGGDEQSDYDNQIDMSNLVEGRPIYYIMKASNSTYDSSINAGTLYCTSCVNVTIKDININKNDGMFFWNTTNSRIQNVSVSNSYQGIYLSSSSNNTLSNNNVSGNIDRINVGNGIYLGDSSNNTLIGNNVSNNSRGISLSYSSNNTLVGNNVSNNNEGINLYSSNNTLVGNNVSNNDKGIYLYKSSNNTLIGNNVLNNSRGIYLYYSSNNNMLSSNYISLNEYYGIYLWSSSNNTLIGNNISNNNEGIYLFDSSNNNMLSSNYISSNKYSGITIYGYKFWGASQNNNIYNNFFKNINNIRPDNWAFFNIWNITRTSGTNIIGGTYLGGNVWANLNGTGFSQTCADNEGDGICDSPNKLDSNDVDYLPLAYKPAIPDSASPVINSVNLDNTTPNTGQAILVMVNATDNVAVTSVEADGTALTVQGGNTNTFTWSGTITAIEGTHNVNVSAHDAAGNVAWDNSISYTATTLSAPGAPIIVNFAPISPVNDPIGAIRTFNITTNQIVDVIWYINGTELFNQTNVTQSVYTNASASQGTWIVSATATNVNGTTSLEWTWVVTGNLKGDLNDNGIPADAGDLVLMKRASIGEIQADSRYDLNNNGQNADAGDLVLMKRASIGEIIL